MLIKIITVILISFYSICSAAQSKLNRKAIPFSEDIIKTSFLLHYDFGFNWEKEYADNFEIKATFNIDTLGKIINLKVENKKHLLATEKFIMERIMNTSGCWLPEIKNCNLVISDTITFIFRKRTTIEELERIEQKKANCAYWDNHAMYYYHPSGFWGYYHNSYDFDVTYDCPDCSMNATKQGN